LQLAANYLALSAVKCKKVCTEKHKRDCDRLLEKLDLYVEHMEAQYPDIADIVDDGIKLPLQGGSSSVAAARGRETEGWHEAFVEFQLIQRLQRSVRGTSNLISSQQAKVDALLTTAPQASSAPAPASASASLSMHS